MTKGRTGEQSAHRQEEEELFRLEHGGGGMGAGRWVEGRWKLGGMLWQCSPSLPEGHQVLVRNSTRAGELEADSSLLWWKYFQPRECPALAPAPQPGLETNHQLCRTDSISHARDNVQQLPAQGGSQRVETWSHYVASVLSPSPQLCSHVTTWHTTKIKGRTRGCK